MERSGRGPSPGSRLTGSISAFCRHPLAATLLEAEAVAVFLKGLGMVGEVDLRAGESF